LYIFKARKLKEGRLRNETTENINIENLKVEKLAKVEMLGP
jgi:hypothetical protein